MNTKSNFDMVQFRIDNHSESMEYCIAPGKFHGLKSRSTPPYKNKLKTF